MGWLLCCARAAGTESTFPLRGNRSRRRPFKTSMGAHRIPLPHTHTARAWGHYRTLLPLVLRDEAAGLLYGHDASVEPQVSRAQEEHR